MSTPQRDTAWRHRDFRFLLTGRVIDTVGNAAAPVALAFAVIDLTGSTADLGLVVGARSLANVALLLFGGVLADRWKRSTVLVWSNMVSGATQAAVATLILTGQATISRLVVLGLVNGATAAMSFPASNALVPQTVPTVLVPQANALNRLGTNGASMAGAALGGLAVAVVGPGWGLAADAASFLLAGMAYAAVRAPAPVREGRTSTWQDLREGWSAFTSARWIWLVVGAFAVVNASWTGGIHVLGPAVADRTIGRAAWGMVLASLTAGLILGALLTLRRRARFPLRAGMACTIVLAILPLTLGVSPVLPLLLPAALVAGACLETFGIAWDTALQQHVPEDRLARVYSYDALGSFVAIPVGEVAVGPIAEALGERTVLVAIAVLIAAAALATLASRSVRDLRRVEHQPGPPTRDPAPTLSP